MDNKCFIYFSLFVIRNGFQNSLIAVSGNGFYRQYNNVSHNTNIFHNKKKKNENSITRNFSLITDYLYFITHIFCIYKKKIL